MNYLNSIDIKNHVSEDRERGYTMRREHIGHYLAFTGDFTYSHFEPSCSSKDGNAWFRCMSGDERYALDIRPVFDKKNAKWQWVAFNADKDITPYKSGFAKSKSQAIEAGLQAMSLSGVDLNTMSKVSEPRYIFDYYVHRSEIVYQGSISVNSLKDPEALDLVELSKIWIEDGYEAMLDAVNDKQYCQKALLLTGLEH